MSSPLTIRALGVVIGLAPSTALAQSLASRVDGAPAGHVQFSFAARAGVCGNGRSYIQTAPGSYSGSIGTETMRAEPCEAGPVRVVLDRADREIISIQAYVGPANPARAATDLGRVSGQQAVDYLLGLAARAEGRVGRDAIFPATLADSATTIDGLIAVARNQALPRETRTSALSSVTRPASEQPAVPARVVDALVTVARDESDNINVRRQAVMVLGRLDHGAGVPPLIEMARQTASQWVSREAMTVLASSGDPRARTYLRSAISREDLTEEAVAIAIRALGQQYSTREDATLLRTAYPRLRSERTRDAVLTAVADVGGSENVRWLLDVVKNESENPLRRRKALDNASRAGAPIADLVKLYDGVTDQTLKDALVSLYARSAERAAVDRLIAVAKTELNLTVRKRAVTLLGTLDDPRAKEALKELLAR